jgi:SAM-dependent methyltransferase
VDELRLLIDLHKDGQRQGPGGDYETRLAIALSGLKNAASLRIADIGCGTGASTLVLAGELDDVASRAGVADRVTTLLASMKALPFAESAYDAIWSEGAIYNMGFAAGIEAWRKYLKPGGVLAVSELTWMTDRRPEELQAHWEREYPEVDTASGKMAVLERFGFSPIAYFTLPEHCWLDNCYRPLQQRFPAFLDQHQDSEAARAIVSAEEKEISLYRRYKAFVGYGYYIARKATP